MKTLVEHGGGGGGGSHVNGTSKSTRRCSTTVQNVLSGFRTMPAISTRIEWWPGSKVPSGIPSESGWQMASMQFWRSMEACTWIGLPGGRVQPRRSTQGPHAVAIRVAGWFGHGFGTLNETGIETPVEHGGA